MLRLRAALVATGALAVALMALLAGLPPRLADTAPLADVAPVAQPTTSWSAPAKLSACPAAAAAHVVFPSDSPSHATGAGAIVWDAASACPGGGGARVAALGAGDLPSASIVPRTAAGMAIAPRGPLLASGAPHGQIVIAGVSTRAPAAGLLIQGAAGGPFARLNAPGGAIAPMALSTAYLGDVALAAAPSTGTGTGTSVGGLNVHVERFFSRAFTRSVSARGAGGGPIQALTLALDYRGEALAVWAQRGAMYARVVPNKGRERRIQRLALVGASPRIAALLSDDERGIVAWADQRGTQTSVYIDRSGNGVRFGAPQLLERFRDPDGLASPDASPSLVRLSSESVLLAWAGVAEGHWVLRYAAVDMHGVLGVNTIAAPGGDALLADLATGPDDDALALWTEPLPTAAGRPDMAQQALFAARAVGAHAGGSVFDKPEELETPAPVSGATVALDPQSDRAVAAWQGEAGALEYSIAGAQAGS